MAKPEATVTTHTGIERVAIENSELRTIASTNVPGQVYQIKVFLPNSYRESATARYPVLYLLDGDHAFAMATDIIRYLGYAKEVPELIVVAVAYGSTKGPDTGGGNMRNRDLTPFDANGAPRAGGESFRRFIKDELFPFVDLYYRTDPSDRALWGYSRGGFFGLFVLFRSPELFSRYIIISPVLGEGRRAIFSLESEFAATHRHLPARLYLAVGEFDALYPPFPEFVKALKSRDYGGLRMEWEILSAGTHFSIGAEGLTRGLKSVYGKKSIFETMLRDIRDKGFDHALELYHKLKETDAEGYNFAENELNSLGYYLLEMDQVSEGIAVFELNVAAYPDAWNAYDSLAEAYLIGRDVKLAIRSYERSLELNPHNAGAAGMLRKLQEEE